MAGIQIIGQFVLPSWSINPHPTPIKNVDKPYPILQYRKLIMSDVISSKNAALLSFYKTTILYLFGCVLLTRSEPISEVWGSQPVNRHYFQNISLVEKRWKLFSHQCGSLCVVAASPAKSDFMLLWDDHLLQSWGTVSPDNYLADSFDTWLYLHPLRSKNSLNC